MKPRKYRNQPTSVDGIRFASKLEARRYSELKLLERAGEIRDLETHPRFRIEVNGVHICDYVADFAYFQFQGMQTVYEDTKGVLTPDCRIKLALVRAVHGVNVQLIKARAV